MSAQSCSGGTSTCNHKPRLQVTLASPCTCISTNLSVYKQKAWSLCQSVVVSPTEHHTRLISYINLDRVALNCFVEPCFLQIHSSSHFKRLEVERYRNVCGKGKNRLLDFEEVTLRSSLRQTELHTLEYNNSSNTASL